MNYLTKTVLTYRCPTLDAALELRKSLSATEGAELSSFSYMNKNIKEKGEVVEEYVLCKATLSFNDEKFPGTNIMVDFEVDE